MKFLLLLAGMAAAEPLFTNEQIDTFAAQVKKKSVIPAKAVDIIFDFYKNNRATTGGLKDASCLLYEKKYQIRNQDSGMIKKDLAGGVANEECLCVMDYTVTKLKKRGHCIFLSKTAEPKIESFVVGHGSGSKEKDGMPVTFTNSLTHTGTTLSGLHLTANKTYTFGGKAQATGPYNSTGLSLYGMEKDNWTAGPVGKATHGAPYVVDDGKKLNVGRSHGCPAMTIEKAKEILPRCAGRAAWLNYTTAIRDRASLAPIACDKLLN